jgi:transaldolase
MNSIKDLRIKLFADGADIAYMKQASQEGFFTGFTTNPSLMRKAGVENYEQFAKEALAVIPDLPISFEVLADDFVEMAKEARKISAWGTNVYVKIPVCNTRGESSVPLIKQLIEEGIPVNVTAILSKRQIEEVVKVLNPTVSTIISVFAGRIANTGRNPKEYVKYAVDLVDKYPKVEVLWASIREVYNIFDAEDCGCHIITVTNDIFNKLSGLQMDLDDLSVETVQMFYNDAKSSGLCI